MPVAGVARNPFDQVPGTRFRRAPVLLMERRQDRVVARKAEPGTVRRLWRNLVGYQNSRGSADFSWTLNDFEDEPPLRPRAFPVSSPLRYLVTTVNTLTAGNLLSNPMSRTVHKPMILHPQVPATWAGNQQGRPTVRNRMTSFGSRVTPVNARSADATQPKDTQP